jgi:hypothetical protein
MKLKRKNIGYTYSPLMIVPKEARAVWRRIRIPTVLRLTPTITFEYGVAWLDFEEDKK